MFASKHIKACLMAIGVLLLTATAAEAAVRPSSPADDDLRIGIIGLDTSHASSFTEIINNSDEAFFGDFRVVAAYPEGSQVIESSYSRIPEYTEAVEALGVEIVDSIADLLERVDAVLLLTNDGQRHLEQVLPVLEAGLPVYIGKPIAASLEDAVKIFDAAEKHGVPLFSSSSLRYTANDLKVRSGERVGEVVGASAYSPAPLEEHHPDLFWYGVHGVELLYTAMGTGCETVTRTKTDGTDVVVGRWKDGRLGTFRGLREGEGGYGGTAFGTEGITSLGPFQGNEPLVRRILEFFASGDPPVDKEETLEIFAFMEAADESKRLGGQPVSVQSVLSRARADARLSGLGEQQD